MFWWSQWQTLEQKLLGSPFQIKLRVCNCQLSQHFPIFRVFFPEQWVGTVWSKIFSPPTSQHKSLQTKKILLNRRWGYAGSGRNKHWWKGLMEKNLHPWLGNKLCGGCSVIMHSLAKQKKLWLCTGIHMWSKGINVTSCQGYPTLLQLPWSWCWTAVPCSTIATTEEGPGSPVSPVTSPQTWEGGHDFTPLPLCSWVCCHGRRTLTAGCDFAPLSSSAWKVLTTWQSCTVVAMRQFSKQDILLLPMADSCFYLLWSVTLSPSSHGIWD